MKSIVGLIIIGNNLQPRICGEIVVVVLLAGTSQQLRSNPTGKESLNSSIHNYIVWKHIIIHFAPPYQSIRLFKMHVFTQYLASLAKAANLGLLKLFPFEHFSSAPANSRSSTQLFVNKPLSFPSLSTTSLIPTPTTVIWLS